MSEIVWQPSLMYSNRVHARAKPGEALCGAELERTPVTCALCALLAHDAQPQATSEIRERLEADCAEYDEPIPERLGILSDAELDVDAAVQYRAARALGPVQKAIIAGYAEAEHAMRALGAAQRSSRAARAREHLMETLVALNESLRGHDYAEQTLRQNSVAPRVPDV